MIHPQMKMLVRDLWAVPKQSGDIGVEIELEGMYLPLEIVGWTAKAENSLRGAGGRQVNSGENYPDTPREYVTKGAMSLGTLWTRLQGFQQAMATRPCEPKLVARASTHIHCNMQAYPFSTVIGYVMIYCMIEPVLLRICGPERNGNLFCLPNYETGDIAHAVSRWVDSLTQGSQHWNGRGKYAALNTDPLQTFGSVELRCFPVSIDPETIFRWAQWAVNIRTKAAGWDDPTFKTLVDAGYTYPEQLVREILTSQPGIMQAVHPNNISELVRSGVEIAYEVYRSAKPLLDWDEKAKSKPKPSKGLKRVSWDAYAPPELVDLAVFDDTDAPQPQGGF